jgi:hypothetical protein
MNAGVRVDIALLAEILALLAVAAARRGRKGDRARSVLCELAAKYGELLSPLGEA